MRIMKEAGFNAIRSAHNPISKDMLEACDALGMYVMDETFDMWLVRRMPTITAEIPSGNGGSGMWMP